jgi:hypothetical protein
MTAAASPLNYRIQPPHRPLEEALKDPRTVMRLYRTVSGSPVSSVSPLSTLSAENLIRQRERLKAKIEPDEPTEHP